MIYTTRIIDNKFELLYENITVSFIMFSPIKIDDKFNGDPYIKIWGLIVNKNERGKGYGKTIMLLLLDFLANQTNIVELHVMEENHIAVNLYEKLGFKIFDKEITKNNNVILLMFKKLK